MSLNAYCADVKTLLSIDPNVRFIASLEGFFVCFVYLFVLFVLLVLLLWSFFNSHIISNLCLYDLYCKHALRQKLGLFRLITVRGNMLHFLKRNKDTRTSKTP